MASRPITNEEKGGYWLYIVAITVVLIMIVSMAIQAPAKEGDRWVVQSGDVLQYDITGHLNGTAVTGTATANFTVVNMTGNIGTVGGFFTTDLGSWAGGAVRSALSEPRSGACLGGDRIDTIYGAKAVTKYISYEMVSKSEAQAFVITYAGVDSRVIYRINVSGPSFFFSLDLRNSTLSDPADLDARKAVNIPHNFIIPNDKDNAANGIIVSGDKGSNFTYAIGASFVGYWHLPKGAHLNHSMESDGALFYLVTEENIERMEHGGVLESDPTMSLLNGNGSNSALLEGGLYLVVMDAGMAFGEVKQHCEMILLS